MNVSKEDYQSMSTELNTILDSLQSGELDIDQASTAYERGMQLISKLEQHLQKVENKVVKTKASFEDKKD